MFRFFQLVKQGLREFWFQQIWGDFVFCRLYQGVQVLLLYIFFLCCGQNFLEFIQFLYFCIKNFIVFLCSWFIWFYKEWILLVVVVQEVRIGYFNFSLLVYFFLLVLGLFFFDVLVVFFVVQYRQVRCICFLFSYFLGRYCFCWFGRFGFFFFCLGCFWRVVFSFIGERQILLFIDLFLI